MSAPELIDALNEYIAFLKAGVGWTPGDRRQTLGSIVSAQPGQPTPPAP